jgi:hypothetical protein
MVTQRQLAGCSLTGRKTQSAIKSPWSEQGLKEVTQMQQINSIVALAVRSIKAGHAIQQRATLIDNIAINDYAVAMTAGSVFPPIVALMQSWLDPRSEIGSRITALQITGQGQEARP